MTYQLLNIFPTTIYVGNINNHLIHKNDFYRVYPKYDFEDASVSENSGNPLLHLDSDLNGIFKEIKSHVETYIYEVLSIREIFNIAITKTWLSRSRRYEQNIPWHIHSTSHISFVYYINTPKDSHVLEFLNFNGTNNLFLGMNSENENPERMIIKNYNQYNADAFYMNPSEGNIIIFPSSTRHRTRGINTKFKGERLAIVGDITLLLKEQELSLSMGYLDPKLWKIYD